jgi:hypothetical protein
MSRKTKMEQRCIHSVELLEMALDAAKQLGYGIREETLDGVTGGVCELKGRKWFFLDPRMEARERLSLVLDALSADPAIMALPLPGPLRGAIGVRAA